MRSSKKRVHAPPVPAERPAWPGRRHWLAAAGLCALVVLAYANSFGAGFTLDNRGLLLEDPRIREATGQNLGLILRHTYWWPYGESGLYRPFTTLSHLFNYAVLGNGRDPFGYHLLNLLLHAGNMLLAYALGLRLLRRFWPAVFLAALWAVHPVLTESVTNMVGRADLLAGASVLGGFLLYLKSAEATGARRWAWLTGLMAATTAGVFSKESAVAILGVIPLYELAWWRERRRGTALWLGCLAVAMPILALLYARAAVLANSPRAEIPFWDNPLGGAGFWTAKLSALKIVALYLGRLAWPLDLSCDYSYAQIPLVTGSPADWLAWTVVAAVGALAALLYRWNRTAFFLAGFAFATFLPTSNLLFPIGTDMAERFLYLPALAFAGCLALAVDAAAERFGQARLAPVALGLVAAALAVRTGFRNADWQDDLSLARATVRVSPDSYKAHKMLAAALYTADPGHSQLAPAIAETERSLAILDRLPDARNNPDSFRRAAGYYLEQGDNLRSRQCLLRAIAILHAVDRPAADKARMLADLDRSLAAVCLRLRDASCALNSGGDAVAADPLSADSYGQMANVLASAGRADEAAVVLMQGVLLTQDARLRQELVNLYRQGLDTQGCAFLPGSTGLNRSCAMVHRQLCQAAVAAIGVWRATGQAESANKMRDEALRGFGCSAEMLR